MSTIESLPKCPGKLKYIELPSGQNHWVRLTRTNTHSDDTAEWKQGKAAL